MKNLFFTRYGEVRRWVEYLYILVCLVSGVALVHFGAHVVPLSTFLVGGVLGAMVVWLFATLIMTDSGWLAAALYLGLFGSAGMALASFAKYLPSG